MEYPIIQAVQLSFAQTAISLGQEGISSIFQLSANLLADLVSSLLLEEALQRTLL